jgi:hypothetical protein
MPYVNEILHNSNLNISLNAHTRACYFVVGILVATPSHCGCFVGNGQQRQAL